MKEGDAFADTDSTGTDTTVSRMEAVMAREQQQRTTAPSLVWVPCATCWGQRRIVTIGHSGEARAQTCTTCLGVGERLQPSPKR